MKNDYEVNDNSVSELVSLIVGNDHAYEGKEDLLNLMLDKAIENRIKSILAQTKGVI
tara:strand:+ start:1316 stop:1486 length:171 start_codon:yes stop_codon:yes gene_type:complete